MDLLRRQTHRVIVRAMRSPRRSLGHVPTWQPILQVCSRVHFKAPIRICSRLARSLQEPAAQPRRPPEAGPRQAGNCFAFFFRTAKGLRHLLISGNCMAESRREPPWRGDVLQCSSPVARPPQELG
jgi:hypothetical protein